MKNNKIALRIDDIGASSKKFEVYGQESIKLFGKSIPISFISNFLFIKKIPGISKWGIYEEMTPFQIEGMIELIRKFNAKLTIAITAAWVEADGSLIPYHEKFPVQAKILKKALKSEIIQIVNHGYTHCVIGQHKPRLFSSNRTYHREFWDWLPESLHEEHIRSSQVILQEYFDTKIDLLVPPGNVFCEYTVKACLNNGITKIHGRKSSMFSGNKSKKCVKSGISYIDNMESNDGKTVEISFIPNDNVFSFHDREIVKNGLKWLEEALLSFKEKEFVFVSDL